MPKSITIIIAKTIFRVGRFFRYGGTSMPGLVAEQLDPNILAKLASNNFEAGVIIISGTNGKTTTATVLARVLREAGRTVTHNQGGSNLYRGIVANLIQNASLRGTIKSEIAVFEVDENALERVVQQLKPSHIVLTNLFRDQLDRYGELDSTAKKISQAIATCPKAHLFLNADDPLVANLAGKRKQVSFFGMDYDKETKLDDSGTIDSALSPITGRPLIYSKRYYSHIGIYRADNGEFSRPAPDFLATDVKVTDHSLQFQIKQLKIKAPLGGLYNIYNIVAAFSVAQSFGLSATTIVTSLSKITPAFGRFEKIHYHQTELTILLVKNPVGFNQVIENFLLLHPDWPILFILNDKFADSRDVSWIWDVNFEALARHCAPIIVTGTRAYDMALRLKYANVTNFTTIMDSKQSLKKSLQKLSSRNKAFIVPTYTGMLRIRSYLAKKGLTTEYWK